MSGRAARGPADVDAVAHVFVAELDDRCEITGPDGHHLQRVRRLTPGESVTAADGSGAWRRYEIVAIDKARLVLEARAAVEIENPPPIAVSLAVALTKGGLDDVVAAASELGVERVIPVRTARSVARWDETRAARAVARLHTVAREASMQSRRARVPMVDDVVGVNSLVGRPGLVVADRTGVAPSVLEPDPEFGWTVLVGPEGGLAPDELSALAGSPRIRLGRHVLRASTAPLAALAVLDAEVQRLRPE